MIVLEALVMISIILLCFLLLGIVIPVGYTLGCVISDNIENFLRNL